MLYSPAQQRFPPATMAALVTLALAALAGSIAAFSITLALLPLLGVGIFIVLAAGPRLAPVFLGGLTLLLIGYAFGGRGFAYLGSPPLFVAEPVLFMGLLVLLRTIAGRRLTTTHWLLLAFMAWGVLRTVPYLPRDGLDALRDAVTWGYSFFALALAVSIRRHHLEMIARVFGRFAPWFLAWVPVLFILHEMFRPYLPVAPGSDAAIPYFQPGDVSVHLAGIAGFLIVGLYGWRRDAGWKWMAALALLWLVGFVICASVNRGALLACSVALAAGIVLRPSRMWLPVLTLAVLVLGLAALVNPSVSVEGRYRDVSVRQIMVNSLSTVTGEEQADLEPTKEWRLEWWREIVSYTIHGPYFWTGKGFGVNLANDDGFQVMPDQSLRSPHNTHLTILARMGVPGMMLWIAVSVAFGMGLLRSRVMAQRADDGFRAAFATWLLIYWLAMMVNGAFTLYLEAPQEGIWFWAIFGLGLALISEDSARHGLRRRLPQRTDVPRPEPSRPRRATRPPRQSRPGWTLPAFTDRSNS